MRISQLNLSVIIEEYQNNDTPIHAADNIYHKLYKNYGVKRSSRKNHKGIRTVIYIFPNEKLTLQFMTDVQEEYKKLANK